MRESKIQHGVVRWAIDQGLLPIKLTSFASGGWPDYMFLGSQGQVAFIEFKAPGKKPGLRQELRIEGLRKRGFPVAVIDSYESGIEFLTKEFTCICTKPYRQDSGSETREMTESSRSKPNGSH